MYFPTYHFVKFFDKPQEILNFALQQEYFRPEGSKWPGARTKDLNEINPELSQYIGNKILKSIYGRYRQDGSNNFSFQNTSSFQLIRAEDIKNDSDLGWIHADDSSMMTAIVYLSPNLQNSGTSLYQSNADYMLPHRKKEITYRLSQDESLIEEYKKAQEFSNSRFTKIAEFKPLYNSCLCFDGGMYHGQDWAEEDRQKDRLTLVTFFEEIRAPYFPYSELDRFFEL